VDDHAEHLEQSSRPTAVAVSILDVAEPAVEHGDTEDFFAHWALIHLLLDGHHKIQAAAETARPMQLLSLLSVDHSNARLEDVLQLPELRARPPLRRLSAA
jgi:hypothetical protein